MTKQSALFVAILVWTITSCYPVPHNNTPPAIVVSTGTVTAFPPTTLPVNTFDANNYQFSLDDCFGNYSKEDWDIVLQTCLPLIEQAEARNDLGNIDDLYVIVGRAYANQSRTSQAIEKFLVALEYAKQSNDTQLEGIIYSDLGGLYFDRKQYEQALEAFNNALAVSEKLDQKLNVAADLSNIAATYESMWELDRAIEVYSQSLIIREELGDDTNNLSGKATIFGNLGWLYRRKGEYEKAFEYFDQAITLKRQLGDKYSLVYSLNNRGYTFEESGRGNEAIKDYVESISLIEEILSQQSIDDSLLHLSSQVPMIWPYERLAALLVKENKASLAFEYAERGRAIVTRNNLINSPIDIRENLDPALLLREEEMLASLVIAQNQLDGLYLNPTATADQIQDAELALRAIRTDYLELREVMQLRGGYLDRYVNFETASLSEIQKALPADTTLIIYEISNRFNSVVFLVTNDTMTAQNLDFITEDIDPHVIRFMSDRLANQSELRVIYDYAISPISDLIATSRLLIAADGPLNYVPFAALQAPNSGYLIDDYTISMISSATTFMQLTQRNSINSSTGTSPGLVLSQSFTPGFSTLSNADTEAVAIANTLGVIPINDATESDLRMNSSNSRVIHISAHVELDPYNPEFSAIRLRGQDKYDGRLDAYEIVDLDLNHGTEVVVLSGCNTASGEGGNNSEDFNTLIRAFFTAGTPRVVASLWSVDDKATSDLLANYFTLRKVYGDDSLALRHAMLLTRAKYPEVYFWASFTFNGIP